MKEKSLLLAAACGMALLFSAAAWSKSSVPAIQSNINGLLWNFPAQMLSLRWNEVPVAEIDRKLADAYRERDSKPLWVTGEGPGKRAETLLYLLRNADREGLDPPDYPVDVIDQLWEERSPDVLALLDIALTSGLVAYANDLAHGRLRVREDDPELFSAAHRVEFEPKLLVAQAMAASNLENWLQGLAPDYLQYRKLRAALKQYRQIAGEGGWPTVPDGPTLHPGESDPRVPMLRERLLISGDLAAGDASGSGSRYGGALVAAVKRFQRCHGLAEDGVIGPGTLAALNVTTAERVRQIEMNMERWRWSTIDMGGEFVLVDIAGYRLYRVKNGEVQLKMPVIVGKLYHETPVFSDRIRYIEFNPYWNIPPSIAANEILPKLRRNPGYLRSRHIRLFSGWGKGARELSPASIDWNRVGKSQMRRYLLRQDPGSWNALGTMKFMFPNNHSVYLHDTPNRNLFGREKRAFSHGCVRVGKPHELALTLLGEGWTPERIDRIVKSGKWQIVNLPRPVPVHITYQTAWVDRNGQLLFAQDIYRRDERLAKALYGHGVGRPPAKGAPPAKRRTVKKPVAKPAPKPARRPVATPAARTPVRQVPVRPAQPARKAPPPARERSPDLHAHSATSNR